MKCPHCDKTIPKKLIDKHIRETQAKHGAIGGKKSKRTISPEAQRKMQLARLKNKK